MPALKPLSSETRNLLASCNLQEQLIGIKTEGKGNSETSSIVILSKKEVNCWQLFLRIFNCGKLKNTEVHLKQVAKGLAGFNWANIESEPGYYATVCSIANKALLKNDKTLYDSVSRNGVDVFKNYQGNTSEKHHLNLNPYMQSRHLKALFKLNFTHKVTACEVLAPKERPSAYRMPKLFELDDISYSLVKKLKDTELLFPLIKDQRILVTVC